MADKTEILLESGTNELEIMEFTIDGNVFGINVSKVTEIMMYAPVKPMPGSHDFVEGVFKPRDIIITVVDLAGYLGLPRHESTERDMLIITGFNKMNAAFHVHTVEGIHRISWADIEKPDTTIYGGQDGLATGIAKIKDKLITIIDFEKVIYDISPQSGIQLSDVSGLAARPRNEKPIFIAEDSALLRKMLIEALGESGYTNLTAFNNGQEAWVALSELRDRCTADNIMYHVSCLITDIEMPKMDGHRLTKLVKEDPILQKIPVVIFSSLIDENMRLKGEALGADAQVTKPEIGGLVDLIDQFTEQYQ